MYLGAKRRYINSLLSFFFFAEVWVVESSREWVLQIGHHPI